MKETGKKTEAEEHYRKTIELEPKNIMARNNYANLLRENARYYEAEREVRTALQIEPTNPYVIGTLGDILSDEEYFEDAKKEYQKALINSDNIERSVASMIHNNLGWAYSQLKQYNKAEEEFKKTLALDSMNIKTIRNLRVLGKIHIEPEISKTQKHLKALLSISLVVLFILFLINKISETVFAAQSTILIALLIFIALYHHIVKVKIGTIEFEKGTEFRFETKSQPSQFERC